MNTKTAKRGRPPKGSGEAKSEVILIRADQREKQAFTDAARLAGLPLSAWVRERLRKLATKELQEAEQTVAFLATER